MMGNVHNTFPYRLCENEQLLDLNRSLHAIVSRDFKHSYLVIDEKIDNIRIVPRDAIARQQGDASAKTGKTDTEKLERVVSYRYIEMIFHEMPDGGGYKKTTQSTYFRAGLLR